MYVNKSSNIIILRFLKQQFHELKTIIIKVVEKIFVKYRFWFIIFFFIVLSITIILFTFFSFVSFVLSITTSVKFSFFFSIVDFYSDRQYKTTMYVKVFVNCIDYRYVFICCLIINFSFFRCMTIDIFFSLTCLLNVFRFKTLIKIS